MRCFPSLAVEQHDDTFRNAKIAHHHQEKIPQDNLGIHAAENVLADIIKGF